MSPLRLSVLDQSPIRDGASPAQAIAETLDLAQACERLGYHRYWLAEHHSSGGLAGSAPEILIGRIASLTRRMRIGSGGVMLSHYSALKVAETFRMLETLYPGRIDLGIGRAPGSDGRTAMALAAGPGKLGIEYFPNQIRDLQQYLANELEEGHQFRGVVAEPRGPSVPELWLLGSSDQSAAYAAYFGLPFSFAHFITEIGGVEVMTAYRQHFERIHGGGERRARGSIGIFVLVAETDEEARWLARSRDLWLLKLRTGRPGPFPSPEEADAYPYSPQERMIVEAGRRRTIAGDPAAARAAILALGEAYGVDEAVVVTITHDFAKRLRSYELLAEAFDLALVRDAAQ